MSNHEVAILFRNVAAAYSIKDQKKYFFQILAYQKASEAIEASTVELKDLYKESRLEEVPGIGVTIRARLEELFKTGSVTHFDTALKDIPKAVFVLLNVPTIGPKKAYKLAKNLKLDDPKTAIEDLIIKAKNHEIAKIPTFGDKSEQDILRALNEYREGKGKTVRMTLPYAGEISEKILVYLRKCPYIIKAVVLGSLRRMMATVGDIDIAVATDNPNKAIEYFISYPYKDRIIEKGPTTASFLTSGSKQVDLMTQPLHGFGSLLQHFTGSKNHNVKLREKALKMGYSLSEKGIKNLKTNKIIEFDTEEALYSFLKMPWIPPEIREDKGEIELAIANKLPRLVEQKDILGDLHLHSKFQIEPSHDLGHSSFKEMLEFAAKFGYQYVGFSEHNPSISKHNKNDIYSIISKRNDEIEQLKLSNNNVRIIKMLEIDILASGKLAIDDKSLDMLDCAIVSIHSSFAGNRQEMTKRVLAGLAHPKAKILAHPTGRMINERSGYELDFDQIFDFCKKNNKALEINSWPQRLDLSDVLIKDAVKNGVKLVINTDSHEVHQMSLMKYGVATARRGWAEKKDILNTLPYDDIIKWLRR